MTDSRQELFDIILRKAGEMARALEKYGLSDQRLRTGLGQAWLSYNIALTNMIRDAGAKELVEVIEGMTKLILLIPLVAHVENGD
jgi:hypothetical protein